VLSVGSTLALADAPIDWDALFEAHRPRLLTIADLIVRDREDAADVVQRVFEKTYRERARLDPSLSPLGWLTRLTCNEAISVSRRRRRIAWLPLTGRERSTSYEDSTIDRVVVDRALKRLHPMHRAAVVLFYLHGYNLSEIAAMLDVPRGTVASRLHRARSTLALLMSDHDLRRFP
jgi:RNA polymerase sigma-70 factor, ECF subfamily